MSVTRPPPETAAPAAVPRSRGFLDWIGWVGSDRPEPPLQFVLPAAIVVVLAAMIRCRR